MIGLNLCPFAASPWRRGLVELIVSPADRFEDAIADAARAAFDLLDTPADEVQTTLLIFPHALAHFPTFLDAADALRMTLEGAGAGGILQVATFHPDYCFADVSEHDPSNLTNRSPYPVLHLLREDDIADAVQRHPAPQWIPQNNIDHLRSLTTSQITQIWPEYDRQTP